MSRNLTVAVLLTARDQLSAVIDGASKKLDGFSDRADKVGRKIESAGTRIAAIGVAGQAGLSRLGLDLGTLVGKSIESERALYGIANTAGVAGAAARGMVTDWTIAVNQIAIATNQSQDLVIAAFNDMVAKGLDPKIALGMLKPIGQAATAAGADIRDMASAAQAGFSKLKIDAADSGKSLDIMAQAGKSGAFELRDMAGFFDKITASAANLGMVGQESLASLSAAAQIARRGTGDAASAATNLDNFLSKLNAAVTYKAFEDMGVDLGKLKEEAKASGDYLGYMAQAVQNLTGGDTAKIASLFSDIQAGAFIQGMVRDLDDYKQIRDEALAANGVAAQDFATAMQSAGAQVDRFQISATAAAGSGSAIKEILDALTGIANWANEHPDLAKWLIFGTAAVAVGGGVVAGIGAIITSIGALVGALGTVSGFLVAHPVVAAILGVAAVATAVYVYWDEIVAAATAAWEAIKSVFSAGAELVKKVWLNFTPVGLIVKNWDAIRDAFKAGLATISATAGEWRKIGVNLIQGIIDGIKAKAGEVIDRVKAIGSDALDAIKKVLLMRSPSRAMMLVGENTVLGMLLGMENEAPALIDTAEGIARDTVAALEKPFRDNKGRFLPADAAERAAAEWQRAGDEIEKSLTDALMRGFEGGKGWADNFKDTLKNLFNSLILRPIIQPIAQGGAGMVTGMLGMGGSGSAMAGGMGGGSFLSVGSSLMSAMAPGAISAEIGVLAGGIAETLGASASFAGSVGSAVMSAVPWIGGALAIGAALGIFGGKPSNKAAGGTYDFSSASTKNLWEMTGNKSPSRETMDGRTATLEAIRGFDSILTALGGTSAYNSIGVDIGERDGVQFAFDGGALQSYGNDANAALARLFRELTLSSRGLSESLVGLLANFKGTGEEFLLFGGSIAALQEYAAADPLKATAEAAEAAGRSAWQVWQQQGTDLRAGLAAWDGSAQAAAELAALTQARYQVELGLAQQLHAALANTSLMFGQTIEEMKYGILDAEGKYNHLRNQSAELETALAAAVDPAQIAAISGQLNETAKTAWQLLGEEERKIKIGEYEKYFAQMEALTLERLNLAGATITDERNADLPGSIQAAIEAAMERVAAQFMAAAQTQQKAAETPVTINFNANVPGDAEVAFE